MNTELSLETDKRHSNAADVKRTGTGCGGACQKPALTFRRARVGVARRDGVYRLIALDPIPAGALILTIDGIFTQRPSRYSVQVGPELHVDLPRGMGQEDEPQQYRWRYLNHACSPNAGLRGLRLYAGRAIQPWEEISFDYNTTEYRLAEPFKCGCGDCDGRWVRGFAALEPEEQDRLKRSMFIAEYLREAELERV